MCQMGMWNSFQKMRRDSVDQLWIQRFLLGNPIQVAIMSTPGSSSEVQKMIQQAVKEAIDKEKKNEPKDTSKKKSSKPKTESDESRKMAPTASNDPHMGIDTWPCLGKHIPQCGRSA